MRDGDDEWRRENQFDAAFQRLVGSQEAQSRRHHMLDIGREDQGPAGGCVADASLVPPQPIHAALTCAKTPR